MKDFGDFMDYFSDHISEVSYDTVQIFKRQRFTGITLSQDDVLLGGRSSEHRPGKLKSASLD